MWVNLDNLSQLKFLMFKSRVCICIQFTFPTILWHEKISYLTFKQLGWYLNFGTWFVKNMLFEQKEIVT
jgi:hypothetical protein